jgi:hypothetical protein
VIERIYENLQSPSISLLKKGDKREPFLEEEIKN